MAVGIFYYLFLGNRVIINSRVVIIYICTPTISKNKQLKKPLY